MKGEIRSIRTVTKYGAHGDKTKMGTWVYGTRGRTGAVPVRHEKLKTGNHLVYSFVKGKKLESEFTSEEWNSIYFCEEGKQVAVCNSILNKRL